jgi:hypothetical protein
MQTLGFLIILASTVALFIGMIKPSIFKGTRSDALKWCSIGFFGGLFIFIVFLPKLTPQQQAEYNEKSRLERIKDLDKQIAEGAKKANVEAAKKKAEATAKEVESMNIASLSKFSAIKNGMLESSVYEVMGGSGEVISESEVAGIKTSMHMWRAEYGGGNMNIMFQHGIVVSKAQFGLK